MLTPSPPGLGTRDPRLRHLRHGVQDPSQHLGQLVGLKQLCWESKLHRHVLPATGSASHSFQAALMTLIEDLSPVELHGSPHRWLGGTRELEGTVLGMALPSGELGVSTIPPRLQDGHQVQVRFQPLLGVQECPALGWPYQAGFAIRHHWQLDVRNSPVPTGWWDTGVDPMRNPFQEACRVHLVQGGCVHAWILGVTGQGLRLPRAADGVWARGVSHTLGGCGWWATMWGGHIWWQTSLQGLTKEGRIFWGSALHFLEEVLGHRLKRLAEEWWMRPGVSARLAAKQAVSYYRWRHLWWTPRALTWSLFLMIVW